MNRIALLSLSAMALMPFCIGKVHAQTVASLNTSTPAHAPAWSRIKERDILWKKRVWRDIDVREKGNECFATGKDAGTSGLLAILIAGIEAGGVKAYSPVNDRFTDKLTVAELAAKTAPISSTEQVLEPQTGTEQMVTVVRPFNPNLVSKFRIKEDWLFDDSQCKLVTRIVGLAPLMETVSADGNTVTYEPMFWVYYPDSQEYLSQKAVTLAVGGVGATWYDVFENRQFMSRIDKVVDTKQWSALTR